METTKYSFEEGMTAQENNDGKVVNAAVAKAKENMERKQLEEDALKVERRLRQAETDTAKAEKEGRYASKKRNILKTFSEGLNDAKAAFEADGNWKAYDEKIDKLKEEKSKAIAKAKRDVYGDDAWSICD